MMHIDLQQLWSFNWEKLSAIAGLFVIALGWATGFWNKVVLSLRGFIFGRPAVPRSTIRIVPMTSRCTWQAGTADGKPCVFVSAHLKVTNVHGHGVELPETYLIRPRAFGGLTVSPTPIPPQNMAQVDAMYTIVPFSKNKPGADMRVTLAIVDQYGNVHRKRMVFRSR